MIDEVIKSILYRLFLLLSFLVLAERLVLGLKEESHGAEASALKEEVEVCVILFRLFLRLFDLRDSLGLLCGSRLRKLLCRCSLIWLILIVVGGIRQCRLRFSRNNRLSDRNFAGSPYLINLVLTE